MMKKMMKRRNEGTRGRRYLKENDEDILRDQLPGVRISHKVVNLRISHKKITTSGTEEDAFKNDER